MPRAGWLALGAILGALLAAQLPAPALGLMVAAVCLVAAIGGLAVRRIPVAAVGFAATVILCRAVAGGLAAPAADTTLEVAPGTADHRAVVLSLNAPSGGQQRAVVELQPPDAPDHVYAWLPRYPAVAPGDRISFRGSLDPAPEGPGFGEFLARSGIRLTSRARTMDRLGTDSTPLAALEQVRRGAGDALARVLPEPHGGLAAAMLIGLRDLVSRDVADAFRVSGLSHVVAISGWHIALLGGVVAAALRGLGRRPRSLLVLAAIMAYSILAGASPSIMRAALMATVVLLARESGRQGQASAALGLAAAGMLLVDPRTVEDIGFQLSLTATAGLLRWSSPLGDRFRRWLPARTPDWLIEALAVSLAAQAATLPLVLFHFGRLSLVAPLANLLVAPLVAPVMLVTVVALAAGVLVGIGLPALTIAPFTLIGALAIGAMIAIARICAGLPLASVDLPPPLDVAAATLCGLGLLFALRRRRSATAFRPTEPSPGPVRADASGPRGPSLRTAVLAAASGLSLLFVLVAAARTDGRLHMTVLDVGQGDAILLQGPSGGRMLVDTGPDPDRLLSLLDERIPAWDRRLDLVVITHPHEDHVAGLALLLERYRVGGVLEPGMVGPGPGDAAFRRRMAQLDRQAVLVAAGDRLTLDGVRIDVHWPLPGRVPIRAADTGTGVNNVSIVLELRFGERRFLLTGDVEEEIDPHLLAAGIAGPDGSNFDVLKVAHHGSATATTDAFVARLQPRIAVVSAGWGNPYGHPSPATVARLEQQGARLFRTDLDGSVDISTDGRDLLAHAGGGRPRPARPAAALPPGLGFCPIPTQAAGRRRPYNRADGRSLPHRSRASPARARSACLVRGPLLRRGRSGVLPRRADGGARHGGRRATRRGCCAPA